MKFTHWIFNEVIQLIEKFFIFLYNKFMKKILKEDIVKIIWEKFSQHIEKYPVLRLKIEEIIEKSIYR